MASSDDDEYSTIEELGPTQRSYSAPISKKNIFTPRLIGALDKCEVSDRHAIHILSAAIDALGLSIQNYILNRTSLQQYRSALRKQIAVDFVQQIEVADFFYHS